MASQFDLSGKTAVVTGAAQGLGRAIALALAEAGAPVAVLDVADGSGVADEIVAGGGKAVFATCDVSDFGQCQAAVAAAEAALGPVHTLVNNAALYGALSLTPFDLIDEALWNRVLAVNVTGVWNMCRAVAPGLRARQAGSIVNVSSSTARTGVAMFAHYVASKGAVIGLTRALARELGEVNVRVNTLSPTGLANDSTRAVAGEFFDLAMQGSAVAQCLHRNPGVEDMTGTVVYLASDASAFVTGQTLAVDGGLDLL
jgi:3-oxoacyl-[acyl-carrier protein] reductase